MTSRSPYEEHRPRYSPGRLVACVWTRANPGRDEHGQLVVPDGCVDLVWRDGDVQLVGPDRRSWVATMAPGETIAGIRLRPGVAPLLLGRMPAPEMQGRQVPLTDVVARGDARPAGADSPQSAVAVLDAYIAGLARSYEADEAVLHAIKILSRETPHVPDLAERVGLSERQLRRRFTDAVGYAPKTLHGILRFQRAVRIGRRGPGTLAGIAYEAGYADQAHFTREVKRLAGTTPARLLGPARPHSLP
ncbi:AraC family transcriptional regulator [Catenulispora subtropica]|uniref:Helix-turn-helix transcriptional regulator n=1 Tax=Catenulispora subtropica TaxID=450798 RepID=A0ABN2TD14_9ACTN